MTPGLTRSQPGRTFPTADGRRPDARSTDEPGDRMMPRRTAGYATLLLAVPLLLLVPAGAGAQDPGRLRTAPERTDFQETTRYADVIAFMEAAAAASPLIHLTTFGYTMEGRALPLAVVGRLSDGSPETVRATGRTVVYLQGNIHAGEVEGKEVLLMLLRDIAQGRHTAMLDSLVLLVAPIFNADGNERVSLLNRPAQHGPVGGMGTRPNAQGLNINRDHTKLDSPEARSLARMLTQYDPHVAADLHTTNGTRHAYHLTYSPPLHPNTHPSILAVANDRLFPEMRRNVRERSGWEFYDYGNVQGQGEARGWYTFDHRARFSNNYWGIRNRIGLLSEAYSYATFEDRITATRYFVDEVLRFAHANAGEIRRLTAQADGASIVGQTLATRAGYRRSPQQVEILMGEVVEERNPYSGAVMLRRTDARRPERMWEYTTFQPTESERVPRSYLVPANLAPFINNLSDQGVSMEPLAARRTMQVERFRVDSTAVAAREFEGRLERQLHGAWETASVEVPAGTMQVSMTQPLARLIFILLEPRSDDGLVNWNLAPRELEGAAFYPVMRVR
jgi:hypothetical protein